MLKTLSALLALLLTSPVLAAPPAGKSLFPKPGIEMLQPTNKADLGKAEIIPVTGQPFKTALRLTTLQASANPWDVQVNAAVPVAVQNGEVMLAEFWVRAAETKVESGEANSEFVFERVGDPWTKAVSHGLSIGQAWMKVSIPFTAVESLEAGKSQVCFRMGYRPQAFELADFKLTTFGTSVKIEDLPKSEVTYGGMAPDAPWRKEAQARIDKVRKGDLVVTVKDAKGASVASAKVSVRMKRQAFGFGTAVVAQKLAVPGGDNDRYQKEVERLFNRVVFENDMKWGPWEEGAPNNGYWRRQYVQDAMRWLSDRHFDVRGHNMVWGSWRWMPGTMKALQADPKAVERAIQDRIADVGGAMKGQLVEWDVVNEPSTEHDLTDLLGKKAIVGWYQAAKKADPKALLVLNDYPGPDTTGHLDQFEGWIKYLLENKAPLEGIGLQGHVGGTPWSIPALLAVLDRFGANGLPIAITEYDTQIKDEALDAQFTRDFLTAVFSHPSVNSFLMWGFWDGAHWHSQAPLFHKDWTLKPAGKAYEDLVLREWWTNADGATDASGAYQVRGFLGDYEVTVKAGSRSKTVPAKLTKDGLKLSVVLK